MRWFQTNPSIQWADFLLIVLMNLTVLPLMLLLTMTGIILFPVLFFILKITSGWSAERIMRQLIWVYGRGWLTIMIPFIRFKGIGLKQDKIRPPCILVANHLSFFDIYCLAVLPFSNVSMAIRNWPFKMFWYAPFMHLAGYLNVEKLRWEKIYESAAKIFSKGGALLFFPEGHRSRDGELQRFYSGAFKLAVETGVKIVPLCIKGTSEVLPPGRWWLKPAKVTVKALEPVDPKSYTGSFAHRLMRKKVKSRMIQSLKEMDLDIMGADVTRSPSIS
jgi:1-acyl-sn-glycerol-3-phosphate acyltransferase